MFTACIMLVCGLAATILELLILRGLALQIDSHSDLGVGLGLALLSVALVKPRLRDRSPAPPATRLEDLMSGQSRDLEPYLTGKARAPAWALRRAPPTSPAPISISVQLAGSGTLLKGINSLIVT